MEGSIDIFQSYEAPFMTTSVKFGDKTRAMQKLAKQAAYNVFQYYEQLIGPHELTTEIIAKGIIHNFDTKFERFDSLISYSRTVSVDTKQINTDKLFHKAGLVVQKENTLLFYKNKFTKAQKYGYRRLFQHELLIQDVLEKYVLDETNNFYYTFSLTAKDSKEQFNIIFDYINKKDPSLQKEQLMEKMDEISKDIIQELTTGIIQDLIQNIGNMEAILNDMMTKLESIKENKQTPGSKYNINVHGNTIGTSVTNYH